jgi:dTDP-4-dehydrorhamnose reductase
VGERVVILGARGQVGSALLELLGERGVGFARDEADLSRPESLDAVLERARPTAVINTAAYNLVDLAEKEQDLARRVNAEAPARLARWCRSRSVPFIHYSTDYVFPGDLGRPCREDDPTGPLSEYARSKLAGEQAALAEGALVARTSWVFDSVHKNFVTGISDAMLAREKIQVVTDQTGTPTYAPDLARATLGLVEAGAKPGLLHLCNFGFVTRYGFAEAIRDGLQARGVALRVREIARVTSAEFAAPARRPLYSALDPDRTRRERGAALPRWENALARCLDLLAVRLGKTNEDK